MKVTYKQGECPNCGSDNIEYYDNDSTTNQLIDKGICYDCDSYFEEYYQYRETVLTKIGNTKE